jgi:hypothetical protein
LTPVHEIERGDSERIGAAIRAAADGVEAPQSLRAGLHGQRETARRRRNRLAVPALAVVLLALGTAVSLLAIGSGGGPSLADAAGLALSAPTQPAPPPDTGHERFLRAGVGAVRFPNYRYSTPFATAGARRDELAGRHALTVVYRHGAKRVGYTIVGGKPLPVPAGARRVVKGDLRLAVLRRGGALVVAWRQGGHTCVLATHDGTVRQLLAWADWS